MRVGLSIAILSRQIFSSPAEDNPKCSILAWPSWCRIRIAWWKEWGLRLSLRWGRHGALDQHRGGARHRGLHVARTSPRGRTGPAQRSFLLGTVMYEMATGRLAFGGGTTAVVFEAILNRSPTPVLRINPDLVPDCGWIISKLLEKDRGLRYQSAAELQADLKRVKRDTESSGVPASISAIRPRPQWRHPAAMAAAAALVLVATFFAFSPRSWRQRVWSGLGSNQIQSIAVLPFANTLADPNLEYLADGVTDGVISSLSRMP